MTLRCEECNEPYPFPMDLVLPDQQWKVIAHDGANILCADCILFRARLHGGIVALAWIEGLNYEVKP